VTDSECTAWSSSGKSALRKMSFNLISMEWSDIQ